MLTLLFSSYSLLIYFNFFPIFFFFLPFFIRFFSVFMHYRSEVHADLVEKKSVDLDHSVKVVRDDMALIHFENMNNDRINGSDTIANDNYNNDNYNNDDDNNDDIINIDINKNIRVKPNNTKVFSLQADGINF